MAELQTGRVTVEEGIVFGRGGGRDLKCDVFMPPQQGTERPGVLLVHGGGWVRGDRSQLRGYGILLGRLGYVCVACEYRLAGEAKWPAQIHDVKAALRWMRANASQLGIDPRKIAVEGNSAGGHLSLIVAGTPNLPAFEGDGGNQGVPTDVAACVAFYAPTQFRRPGVDMSQLRDAVAFLFGPGVSEETVDLASPITHAKPGFPPTMLLTGNKDQLVDYRESLRMQRALADANVPAELHVFDGLPHAFDALPDFGRQCASLMALFLDRVMVNPRAIVVPGQAETTPVASSA